MEDARAWTLDVRLYDYGDRSRDDSRDSFRNPTNGIMALIHDSTAKDLIKANPRSWLRFAGPNIPDDCSLQVEDSDVSHISAAADAVIQVSGPIPWIAHFEFYSSREPEIEREIVGYHGALHRRWGCWINCAVLLLRSEANLPDLTGIARAVDPLDPSRQFHIPYHLVRVWTLETEEFLEGGLGTLPLAVLAKGSSRKMASSVWRQVRRRIEEQCEGEGQVRTLLAATRALMGLKFDQEFVERAAKMINWEDSSVMQPVIQRYRAEGWVEGRVEGENEGRRAAILRMGRKRLGEPAATDLARLKAINNVDRLDRIADQLLEAESWKDVLKIR